MADAENLGRHARAPWGHPGDAVVRVHTDLATCKGTALSDAPARAEWVGLYEAAKRKADADAAAEIVARCASDDGIDRLVDSVMAAGTAPIFVAPYPAYDDEDGEGYSALRSGPRNMIPFTFAAYLSEILGGTVDGEIVQAARVGRTKLKPFPRFLYQPRFVGVVRKAPYILVDDVFTMGGTLAALRSHIASNGGTVIAVTTLAHKDGFDQPFAIRKDTLSQLLTEYGAGIDQLWKEKIGHGAECLSENEGQTLVRFALSQDRGNGDERLQALRDRLAEAAAKCE